LLPAACLDIAPPKLQPNTARHEKLSASSKSPSKNKTKINRNDGHPEGGRLLTCGSREDRTVMRLDYQPDRVFSFQNKLYRVTEVPSMRSNVFSTPLFKTQTLVLSICPNLPCRLWFSWTLV